MMRHTAALAAAAAALVGVAAAPAAIPAAAAAAAQVVETPQPFDSAGRILRLTPAVADSLALRPPLWPVAGDFAWARLYRQSSGGYVLVVERPNGALERTPMLDESVAALRGAVARAGVRPAAAAAAAAVATTPAPSVTATQSPPPSPVVTMPAAASVPRRAGSATENQVVGGQALLGTLLYGPLAAAAINGQTDEPTVPYITYLGAIAGSLAVGKQLADNEITRAQNTLSLHMAVHGAAAGAALAYAAGGDEDFDGNGYPLAALVGGVGGSALGLLVGRPLGRSEAAMASLGADIALLDGFLLISATTERGEDVEITRGQAAGLVGTTAAGYALGTLYSRFETRNITPGDAIVMALGSGIGMLGGLAVVGDEAGRQRTSSALLVGANAGIVAANAILARRFDYRMGQAGLLAAATGGAAYAMTNFPGVAQEDEEIDTDGDGFPDTIRETSSRRVLAFATAGSVIGTWLMNRSLRPRKDTGRETRVGSALPRTPDRRRAQHRWPQLTPAGFAVVPALLPDGSAAGNGRTGGALLTARFAF